MLTRFTILVVSLCALAAVAASAQSGYQTISVTNGGTITGTVKWSGPVPHLAGMTIFKDQQVCDPEGKKTRDLERLIVGSDGGVANTVVYLKNISSGKAFDLPQTRRFLDQKHCRYEPHILLVPESQLLEMKSSDPVLHTVHMDGAASYNLPFPFPNQVISRNMQTPGVVNLKCNGGHTWMNAEMMVVPHPYYAVTGEDGKFEITGVPPGSYQLIAWHEGWDVVRSEGSFDVLTERRVTRPVFSEPKTWEKPASVTPSGTTVVNFEISGK